MVALDELLGETLDCSGSDLHIKAGSPPLVRIHGELLPMNRPILSAEEACTLSYQALKAEQRAKFEEDRELDFAYILPDRARFRGNVYQQRGAIQSVFRTIPLTIQSMQDLKLPPVCRFFCERPRGLVLITGPSGSGKSTTQAAMIDYINTNHALHIVTIEDPIEFVHEDKQALVNQRELERDTHSFTNALRAVLRQDPDVILIGEMRDLETISLAVTAAETGHLVFGTLHTTDAVQTVDRIIDAFPQHQQQQIRMQLSVNLIGVVSQTLVKSADGNGRIAAFETLVAVPSVRSLIREAKTHQLASLIQTGSKQGMITMDQSLADLVKAGIAKKEDAAERAQNLRDFEDLCGKRDHEHDVVDTPGNGHSKHEEPLTPQPVAAHAPPPSHRLPFGFRRNG